MFPFLSQIHSTWLARAFFHLAFFGKSYINARLDRTKFLSHCRASFFRVRQSKPLSRRIPTLTLEFDPSESRISLWQINRPFQWLEFESVGVDADLGDVNWGGGAAAVQEQPDGFEGAASAEPSMVVQGGGACWALQAIRWNRLHQVQLRCQP